MLQPGTERNNFVRPQAAQAPAVRWSSYEIRVMAKLEEFVWEYLRSLLDLLGIKKKQSNSQWKYFTLLPQCIACYLTGYYVNKPSDG